MKDLRQTPEYANYMGKTGWLVEKLPYSNNAGNFYIYIKKLPMLPFTTMKLQRVNKQVSFENIIDLAYKRRCFLINFEPDISIRNQKSFQNKLYSFGFRKTTYPYLPTKTLQINLSLSMKQLLNKCAKRTRSYVRKAIAINKLNIINHLDRSLVRNFYFLLNNSGKGYIPSYDELVLLIKSFKKRFFIVTAKQNKNLTSGILVLLSDKCAYYYYSATSNEGRNFLSGYACVWKAIKEAKKMGMELFDFEGIFDERFPILSKWKGFTQFKTRFGGNIVHYSGPYQRIFLPYKMF